HERRGGPRVRLDDPHRADALDLDQRRDLAAEAAAELLVARQLRAQHLDRDRGTIPGNAQVHHAHAARAQPRGQPVVPEPGRVIRPERRASQPDPTPERATCRPGRPAWSPTSYSPTVSVW